MRILVTFTLPLVALGCSMGATRIETLRHHASLRHGCPLDAVVPVNEFAPPAGVVVSVCGVDHIYVAEGSEYREVRDLPPRARVVRVFRADGSGRASGACRPGQIFVQGYSRGGRRVRGYCRRR